MTATQQPAAPTARKKLAQRKERSDAALGHDSQNTSSPEGAKEFGELPKGWRWVMLGEVTESMKNGIYKPASSYADDGLACLRMYNIGDGKIVWRDIKRMRLSEAEIREYELLPGDLLVNRVNSRELVGKSVAIPAGLERCVFESKNIRVRLRRDLVSPEFASYRLLSTGSRYFTQNAQQVVGMASISQPQVARFPLPLPPLPEQRRIVAEIEKQFTRLEAGVAALRRVQANLKRYRAAVLKAACEGKLVPTEAELTAKNTKSTKKNFDPVSASSALSAVKNPSYETGEALLQRILAERRKNWTGRGKYKEPAAPDTANLPPLPEGWTWATLDALAAIKGGITKDQNRKFTEPARSVPYLRVANVQRGHLDLSEVKEILTTEDEIQELLLQRGDILFNEGGDRDKLGRGWVWNDELPECIHQNHVFRARLFDSALNPKLVSWYANTFGQKFFFDEGKHTTNLASISMTKLKGLPVPIPPPAEQTRIVAEVERRLSVVEELESVVSANLQRATRLRQSILQKAFSGELVCGNHQRAAQ